MFELRTEETQFLEALNNNKVRFMIVGLTAAVLQNAHVVTQDIDLWIENLGSKEFSSAVKACNGFYIPPGIVGINPPMLGPESLKIFDLVTTMTGLETFDIEYQAAILITINRVDVRILPLQRIIASKQAANREKDQASLPALRAALDTSKNLI
jgi:hypothetical protein